MHDRFMYRIWDKELKQMYELSLSDIAESDGCWSVFYDAINEQERFVIIQSSGLKDKNGKLMMNMRLQGIIANVYIHSKTDMRCKMTNPIEQEFMKAFNIKPICKMDICTNENTCTENRDCNGCKYKKLDADVYPSITDSKLLQLEDEASKMVWFMGDSLIYEVDKKANKAADFRYRYYACEYSDRLLVEGKTKKEALLKLLCNSYLKERIYNDARKIMGVEESDEIPF